jgi:hypothetical protein
MDNQILIDIFKITPWEWFWILLVTLPAAIMLFYDDWK